MLNTHKGVVESLMVFGEKNDLISEFRYLTDAQHFEESLKSLKPRGLLIKLDNLLYDDQYNAMHRYAFILVDKTQDNVDEVLNAEQENIFVLSTIEDYLNQVMEGDAYFENIVVNTAEAEGVTMVTLSGVLNFVVKRNPSYWKQMEQFNA